MTLRLKDTIEGTISNANSVPWSGVTGKPSTFTPSSHTHTSSQITDFGTRVYDATVSRTKNTVLAAPVSANGVASFRTLNAADIPSLAISKITNLQSSLDGKASTSHNHDSAYAAKSHNHDGTYLKLSGGTLSGAVAFNAKNNTFSCAGGSWINGKTQENVPIAFTSAVTKDGSRYDPYMWGKNTSGDVWNFGGGANNTIGFWGFKNGRTENLTDWGVTINITSGLLTSSGGFSGSLSGNASTATALTSSAGAATQPVYFSNGKPVACTSYANASVKYATTAGSAKASDVYAWAKASTKPSYSVNVNVDGNGNATFSVS